MLEGMSMRAGPAIGHTGSCDNHLGGFAPCGNARHPAFGDHIRPMALPFAMDTALP
jgi:hypothetical protein